MQQLARDVPTDRTRLRSRRRCGRTNTPQLGGSLEQSSRHRSPGSENNPKPGLASPNHTANLSGLVLSCIEADFCKQLDIQTFFVSCLQHFQHLQDMRPSGPRQTRNLQILALLIFCKTPVSFPDFGKGMLSCGHNWLFFAEIFTGRFGGAAEILAFPPHHHSRTVDHSITSLSAFGGDKKEKICQIWKGERLASPDLESFLCREETGILRSIVQRLVQP